MNNDAGVPEENGDDVPEDQIGTAAEEAGKLIAALGERFLAERQAFVEGQSEAEEPPQAPPEEPWTPWGVGSQPSQQLPDPGQLASGLAEFAAMAAPAVKSVVEAFTQATDSSLSTVGAQQETPEPEAPDDVEPSGAEHVVAEDSTTEAEDTAGHDSHADTHAAAHAPLRPGEATACASCPICKVIATVQNVPSGTWERAGVALLELAESLQAATRDDGENDRR